MSFSTYEKNYNVGNIRLDTPYTHFVYELPLLSFGDVLHTVNLSLVYQSKMSRNPYSIAPGFGLNLQKRLISYQDTAYGYESGNGEYVDLNRNEDTHVSIFSDGSQRIVRYVNNSFVLENPDYSTEKYGIGDNIESTKDKYGNEILRYSYNTNSSLNTIIYRPDVTNKKISFAYNDSGKLESISYLLGTQVICTTNLVYLDNGGIKVQHYSGVDYYIIPTETSFTVYSRDYGVTESESYYHSIECDISTDVLGNKAIVANSLVGTSVVDSVTYNFHSPINGKINVLDVTNFHGVTTRTQFKDDKASYSYELNDSMFETIPNTNELYHIGPVNFYNNDQVVGKQSYGDGIVMKRETDTHHVDYNHFAIYQNISGLVTVSGWLRPIDNVTECDIIIQNGYPTAHKETIRGLIHNAWNYFSVSTNCNEVTSVHVFTSVLDSSIEVCDFRLSLDDGNDSDHFMRSYDILIDTSVGGGFEIPFAIGFTFYKGNETINERITSRDILKYKINKAFGTHKNEIYYNDCKGVISTNEPLNIKYDDQTGERVTKNITDLEIGKKYCLHSNSYVTSTKTVDNSELVTSIWHGGKAKRQTFYNPKLDVFSIVENNNNGVLGGNAIYYTRDVSTGLITKESKWDYSTQQTVDTFAEYNDNFTKLLSTTDEFGVVTKYTTDPTWGVVTKTVLRNQDNTADEFIVTDTFDADLDTQYGRNFTKDGLSEKEHNYKYARGRLSELTDGSLKYEFTYSAAGDIFQVVKNSKLLEVHTVDNNRRSFTTNYGSHSVTENYDKYGRLAEISGQIQNEYDINPTASGDTFSTVGKDNADAKLSKSTDLVTGNVTKYAYEKDRVSRIGVFNSGNTQTGRETFTYDKLGRKTYHSIDSNIGNVTPISHSIAYATNTDSPLADNRILSYQCYDNGTLKSRSVNGYDNLKRLTSKNVTMNPQNIYFEKSFTYEGSRISKAEEYYSTRNVGTDEYEYDEHGRITEHTFTSDNRSDCKQYYYDSFGQLIRENNQGLDKTFVYVYDSIGNVTSVKEYDYTTEEALTGTYTEQTFTYGDSSNPDKLTVFGGKAITYDSLGRPTSYDGKKWTWTKDKLARVYQGSSTQYGTKYETCSFDYDAYGRRVRKYYNYDNNPGATDDYSYSYTTTYDYDSSGRLIHEKLVETMTYSGGSSSTREFVYLYDESGIIGVLYGTSMSTLQPYYFHRNLQGDVIAIYDKDGNRKVEYTYDAYGNCSVVYGFSHELAQKNPIRYRGYYYDRETKLYYLNARYYNPEWRRFISPDSVDYLDPDVPNGLNLYAYCGNDPVNYADPSGHAPEWLGNLLVAGAGVLLIAGLAIATIATGGAAAGVAGAVFAGALKGALIGAAVGTVACGAIGYAIDGVDGMWTGMAIGFTGGAVIGAVIGGTIGGLNYSPLKAASNAANRAVPSKGFNINKHLSSAGGNYNKFNLDSSDDILRMVQNGLKSQNVTFAPNKHAKSWQVIVDMGMQIGTKGQSTVKVIIGYGGKIWTMFPV